MCVTSGQQSHRVNFRYVRLLTFNYRTRDTVSAKCITLHHSLACICLIQWSLCIYLAFRMNCTKVVWYSTVEITSINYGCVLAWRIVTLSITCGWMYHHLWSETQENRFRCGKVFDLALLLVSVLNLVKKMEGAKARFTRQINLKKLSKLAR